MAVLEEGRGGLRASDADREQAIDVLKAAFVRDRLARAEFEARVGQALASRTYAELAAATGGIPGRLTADQPAGCPPASASSAPSGRCRRATWRRPWACRARRSSRSRTAATCPRCRWH